jgi:hypothetical protein
MIAPISALPPHIYQLDVEQVNNKNFKASLPQFELSSSSTADVSSELVTPLSLDDESATDTTLTKLPSPVASDPNTINALFEKSPTAPLVVAAAPEKTIASPGLILPETDTATLRIANDLPTAKISLTPKKRSAAPPPPRDPAPLPPPSEVTPLPDPPPPLTSPLPSGPPPVEPGNYPSPQSKNLYYNQNYIGPALSFGNNVQVGAISRFGLGKNISLRPSLFLGNSSQISVPITYDFGFNDNEQFEKNPLVLLHVGGGLNYQSLTNGSNLNPLVVFGADIYFGDGASVLVQLANTFNSSFTGIIGVGLQF